MFIFPIRIVSYGVDIILQSGLDLLLRNVSGEKTSVISFIGHIAVLIIAIINSRIKCSL